MKTTVKTTANKSEIYQAIKKGAKALGCNIDRNSNAGRINCGYDGSRWVMTVKYPKFDSKVDCSIYHADFYVALEYALPYIREAKALAKLAKTR